MLYRALRGFWRAALWVFFRHIEVEGRELVPDCGPLLLVPNHTNALVDPLVLLLQLRRPVTITAKAALAANPLLAALMRALNVITFQRRQDVGDTGRSEANQRAFAECRRRLRRGAAICIFPEGVSHSDPGLRPFRTGAARIALECAELEADSRGLQIVPVGLYFEKKDRFRSSAWIRFGEPIALSEWLGDHPTAGARELTAEIEARVRDVTLSFEGRAELELLHWAAEVMATGAREPEVLGRDEAARLGRRVRWVKALQAGHGGLRSSHPAEVAELERRLLEYRSELRRLGVTPAEAYLPMNAARAAFFVLRELELLLVGFPVALWGTLNHVLPFRLTARLARMMSRDEDHLASNAVFLSLVVFPLFYVAQIVAVWLALSLGAATIYGVALPYSGAVAILYRDRAGGILQRTRVFVRFAFDPGVQERLASEGRSIIAEIERLGRQLEARRG